MPIFAAVAAALLALGEGAPLTSPPAASSPGASSPAASPSEDVRARTLALLGAIDRPVPADAFRRLGPEGERALLDVARSREFPGFRVRALEALVAIGAGGAEEAHRALATDAEVPRAVRRAAVRGLGRLLPAARAAAELRPVLEGDRDPSVRAAAAEALARAVPDAGCAAVRRQVAREEGAGRAGFRRALSACEARPGPGR